MAKPTVFVIIPTYNRAELLPRAVHSVVNQAYTQWRIIIVDDGSTDNTAAAIASLTQTDSHRITAVHQKNGGVGAARNHGINQALATGAADNDIILFLDSDDELTPHALAQAVSLDAEFKNVRCIFVGAQNAQGQKMYRMPEPRFTLTFIDFLQQKAWGEMLVFARAALFTNTDFRFEEDINGGEVLLWWKISQHEPIGFADEVLRIYHNDAPNSLTRITLTAKAANNLYLLNKKIIDNFGELLQEHNPKLLSETFVVAARMAALTGHKKEARQLFASARTAHPVPFKQRLLYGIALVDSNRTLTNILIRLFV